MKYNLKIFGLLLLLSSRTVWAADIFVGRDDDDDSEVKQEANPLIDNFLNPDETEVSRKPKQKWQRFKSLEEQGVMYIPGSDVKTEEPLPPSSYKSDPFANRLDYLEDNLGLKKPADQYKQ